jgi:hypothetical protein
MSRVSSWTSLDQLWFVSRIVVDGPHVCNGLLDAIYRINLIRKKPVDRLGLTGATQDVGMH